MVRSLLLGFFVTFGAGISALVTPGISLMTLRQQFVTTDHPMQMCIRSMQKGMGTFTGSTFPSALYKKQ
jgi:hypothetical protein